MKRKSDEFERKYTEVQKNAEALSKEAEESSLRAGKFQEMIERHKLFSFLQHVNSPKFLITLIFYVLLCRLESDMANMESENQVLRQQTLEASVNEKLSDEVKK